MTRTIIEEQQAVVVCGGSGYIGSECCHQLKEHGYVVINIDKVPGEGVSDIYYSQDLSEDLTMFIDGLKRDLYSHRLIVCSIICFAAYKVLPESLEDPESYYNNNLRVTLECLRMAQELEVRSFIFSSSASVYNKVQDHPYGESDHSIPNNPYGKTKLFGESLVEDICEVADIEWYNLRYFNPIGNTIVTRDTSKSLFGVINKCIAHNTALTINGDQYPTKDGTCIRDFIDIRDLVNAHIFCILKTPPSGTYNVGTGQPNTVLDIAKSVKELVPEFEYVIGPPRPGDEVGNYADTTKLNELGWRTHYSLKDSIKTLLEV